MNYFELYKERLSKIDKSKDSIVVSACLLGCACRYDGKSKYYEKVEALNGKYNLIPVCPEVLGGLPTPRIPSEIINRKVINKEGIDVTNNFYDGANKALMIFKDNNCKLAILKDSSPSCGYKRIYDGSFSGKKIKGKGICAILFDEERINIYTEDDIDNL